MSLMLTARADGDDGIAVPLLLQGDVQIARAVVDDPAGLDVMLPLGALAADAHTLEAARLDLVEQPVEQVGGLIAAEEAALVRQPRELQHDLLVRSDPGHDGVDVGAAEAALEVRHRRVEVAELRRCDHRDEQQYQSESRPDLHICLLCAFHNGTGTGLYSTYFQ